MKSKLSAAIAIAAALVAPAGCGSDTPQSSSGQAVITADPGEAAQAGGSYLLKTTAKQILSSLKNGGSYRLEGTTMTFTFTGGSVDENGTSACQIAHTTIEAVAPEEVKRLVMKFSDGSVDCAEILS